MRLLRLRDILGGQLGGWAEDVGVLCLQNAHPWLRNVVLSAPLRYAAFGEPSDGLHGAITAEAIDDFCCCEGLGHLRSL